MDLAKLQQGRADVHKKFSELRDQYYSRQYKTDRAENTPLRALAGGSICSSEPLIMFSRSFRPTK